MCVERERERAIENFHIQRQKPLIKTLIMIYGRLQVINDQQTNLEGNHHFPTNKELEERELMFHFQAEGETYILFKYNKQSPRDSFNFIILEYRDSKHYCINKDGKGNSIFLVFFHLHPKV